MHVVDETVKLFLLCNTGTLLCNTSVLLLQAVPVPGGVQIGGWRGRSSRAGQLAQRDTGVCVCVCVCVT